MIRPLMFCLLLFATKAKASISILSMGNITQYFSQFGYLPENATHRSNLLHLSDGIRLFQSKNGLNVSGTLDADTMALLATPRCGMSDRAMVYGASDDYVLEGSKWHKQHLTYRFVSYTSDLTRRQQEREIARAFKVWSDASSLTFTQTYGSSADIDILFARGEHADGNPFDGSLGVLAHAMFPRYGGDAHFDEAEHFTMNTHSGINLFQVAAHEFGHSLGFHHSQTGYALMGAFFRGYVPNFRLHSDDLNAVHRLYGYPSSPTTDTTRRPQPSSVHSTDRRPATSRPSTEEPQTTTRQDLTFITSSLPTTGRTSVTPSSTTSTTSSTTSTTSSTTSTTSSTTSTTSSTTSTTSSTTRVTSTTPRVVRNPINACQVRRWDAFSYNSNGHTYFFAGNKFFFRGTQLGRPISGTFYGLGANIDAALYHGYDMTFFKGNQYHSFQQTYRKYPQTFAISHYYRGLPNSPDATWSWNGYTYAAKGTKFYRLYSNGHPQDFRQVWRAPSSLNRIDAAGMIYSNLYFIKDNDLYMYIPHLRRVVHDGDVRAKFFNCRIRGALRANLVQDSYASNNLNDRAVIEEGFPMNASDYIGLDRNVDAERSLLLARIRGEVNQQRFAMQISSARNIEAYSLMVLLLLSSLLQFNAELA